jgi:predicted enzyme related to lactoylglutathione lyase
MQECARRSWRRIHPFIEEMGHMPPQAPQVPAGTGKHPITLVVISANKLDVSKQFYTRAFDWSLTRLSAELVVGMLPAGPAISLRSNVPDDFPAAVPYINVPDVDAAVARVVGAGGSVERAAWKIAGVGTLARIHDPAGTIYGLTDGMALGSANPIPMPLGDNPRPPAGSICSVEMHAPDGAAAGRWFGEQFGWGSAETMPSYVGFDPGAGICGVFQSHTPGTPGVAYIYAADVEAKLKDVEAAGGARIGDPIRIPGLACFGYFHDPSGSVVGLIGV